MSHMKFRIIFYAVSLVLLTGLVYFFGWNKYSPAMQFSDEWLFCARLGLCSCGCLFYFWVAFDFLYDLERWYFVLLKVWLIIQGISLILGLCGVGSYDELAIVNDTESFPSPWIMPLASCWFLFDVLLLCVFRKAAESKWNKALFPFLPLIVFALCYFLCVGLSYLAITFQMPELHVYPQIIGGMLALIIIIPILIIRRRGNNRNVFSANAE